MNNINNMDETRQMEMMQPTDHVTSNTNWLAVPTEIIEYNRECEKSITKNDAVLNPFTKTKYDEKSKLPSFKRKYALRKGLALSFFFSFRCFCKLLF